MFADDVERKVDITIVETDGITPGTILCDRYEIIESLGSGGMGAVYKARQTLIDSIVAIKVLHSHLLKDTASQERFKSEAKAAINLRHERLMAVSDYGVAPSGQPFIVMQYVDGVSLDDWLERQGKRSLEEFFDIFTQVCQGLAHAHKHGVVHRDVKPGNIMLSKNSDGKWDVHIVDFGIAKVLPSGRGAVQHLTQTGEIFGSPLYMSPEQCKGREVDARSDIYSLGCVMFECLTGSPPHQGESAIETLMLHVNSRAPKLSERGVTLKECAALEHIVAAALDPNPEHRYQTAKQLQADLEARKFTLSNGVTKVLGHGDACSNGVLGNAAGAESADGGIQNSRASSGGLKPRDYVKFYLSPLIIAAAAAATVWAVNHFNIKQPTPAIVSSGTEPGLREAELEFQLARDKAAQGFTQEASEYSQKALEARKALMPNSLSLAESMNQRAEIAIKDAQHEASLLESNDSYKNEKQLAGRKQRIAEDYVLAEDLLKSAIAVVDEKTTGVEKSDLPVRYRNNLTTAYLDQAKYADAERLLNEMSQLYVGHQPPEKADPKTADKAFHDLVDSQYERLFWATNREVEAAKTQLAHRGSEVKLDETATVNNAAPFSGTFTNGFLTLNLNQDSTTLSGDTTSRPSVDPPTPRNSISGRVDGIVSHFTCVSGSNKSSRVKVSAVRINNCLVLHVTDSKGGLDEAYIPDDAILTQSPKASENATTATTGTTSTGTTMTGTTTTGTTTTGTMTPVTSETVQGASGESHQPQATEQDQSDKGDKTDKSEVHPHPHVEI